MSPEEVRLIARMVIEEQAHDHAQRDQAIMRNVLIMIGIDPNQPDEQIARDLKDFRDTIAYSDMWKKSVNRVSKVSLTTAVAIIVTGALGVLWLGIIDKIKLALHL